MNKSEFLLLIPGLIYGVGLVDLIRVLNRRMYWETILWAVVLFMLLIVQWFGLYDRLELISVDMGLFTLLLISPLVYTRACNILTPEEEDKDTKEYFLNTRKLFYATLLLMIVINQGLQFIIGMDDGRAILRLIIVFPIIACLFVNKVWIRTSASVLFFVLFLYMVYQ